MALRWKFDHLAAVTLKHLRKSGTLLQFTLNRNKPGIGNLTLVKYLFVALMQTVFPKANCALKTAKKS